MTTLFIKDLSDAQIVYEIEISMMKNDVEVFENFLQQGMDINIVDELNHSLLWHACHLNRAKFVKRLIEQGIALDMADSRFGDTPLMISAVNNNCSIVRMLLDAGANPHLKSKRDMVAASYGIIARKKESFLLLMEAGTDINDLVIFDKKNYYSQFSNQAYVLDYIDKRVDQLSPGNVRIWNAIRLKGVFK